MSAILIDGKAIAATLREALSRRVTELRQQGTVPRLAAILIGDDPAALSYAASQEKSAAVVGIEYLLVRLDAGISQQVARDAIDKFNRDVSIHGVMLHLPVPRPLDGFALQQLIAAEKDVEGVGATNLGLLAMGRLALAPCTAAAAFECCNSTGVEIAGKHAVVVGRSTIVGKPLAMLLLAANATVTQCHTGTRDLASHTRRADILFAAAGSQGLIGAEHVAPGAIVIDVGTNRVPLNDGTGKTKMVGDVRFDEVKEVSSYLTPVPGGVGPVTVAMLLTNTIASAEAAIV
ncbi:MAG TPA: tetrahydrofolate dehydrogenase/cyclohydrolase catalytic domain-containing protein [Phycisphaerae bacterium]|nr:tetrahydrofolate dehydrogenase/cyclohydrolase catalytic domain-containing protein [Phycisphaerae bacterium]